jgi:PCO_ADO
MVHGATRREVLTWALGGYALARTLLGQEALAGPVRKEVQAWISRTHQLCADVQGRKIEPREWQRHVEELYARVPLPELLQAIDFDKLKPGITLPDNRAEAVHAPLPKVEGLPRVFATKVFGMQQGRAIVPHGHRNMVSMHLVLAGEFHLRHFERVEDQPGHLVLRPSIDRVSKPGDLSSISDQRDNVHWLVATKGPAYTFDVIVDQIDPTLGFRWKMDHVDAGGAERLEGGLLRARRIEFDEALRRYGKT